MMKSEGSYISATKVSSHCSEVEINNEIQIPEYLDETYWWAYLHPKGVKFFDHSWIINSILLGNYKKLCDNLLMDFDQDSGDVLQMAAVYGNISSQIATKISDKNTLDVLDVAPIQLQNLHKKITGHDNIRLLHQDATALTLRPQSYDRVLLFFLLHELPDQMKYKVLQQAVRMLKSGGQIIIVDYHKPVSFSPWRYLMIPILTLLEPFAMSLWSKEIISWLPKNCEVKKVTKQTLFTGLYQKVIIDL